MTATKAKPKPKPKPKAKSTPSKKPTLELVKPKPKVIDPRLVELLKQELEVVDGEQIRQQQDDAPVISTGCLVLDLMMRRKDPIFGNGGLPQRNMMELYGPTGVGKTIILFSMIAEAQKRGLVAVLFSEEPSMEFAAAMGVDLKSLIIIDAYSGKGAWVKDKKTKRKYFDPNAPKPSKDNLAEIAVTKLIRASKHPDVVMVAWDSIKGTVGSGQVLKKTQTGAIKERGMEEEDMAVRAKFVEKAINRLRMRVNASVVIVNHSSTPISTGKYGLPDRRNATCGGAFKEFESVYRIKVTSSEIKNAAVKEHPVFKYKGAPGLLVKMKMDKARWGGTNRKVHTHFFYSRRKPKYVAPHWDTVGDVLKLATYLGIIKKKGNYYIFSDKNSKNGEKAAREFLETKPELVALLQKKINERGEDIFEYIEGDDTNFAKSLEMPIDSDDDEDDEDFEDDTDDDDDEEDED